MFIQMPLPGPHGSDSHSFTSGRIGRPGDIRGRLRVPVIPWATPPPTPSPTVPAHQRSSGAADVTDSPGCSGTSNPRGQAHTVRGHRYSGSIGTHPSLAWVDWVRGIPAFCHTPEAAAAMQLLYPTAQEGLVTG